VAVHRTTEAAVEVETRADDAADGNRHDEEHGVPTLGKM
jgi:hypothetical protein